ncbi:hypothetical protein C426_0592 [Lactococcus garvieae DCC43]|uniref:Uncharacterized protein n=2 Tax=Lactococcus garvieae TaxID=1363 RepID=K2PNX5_9LACT|nr:hypothetical protein C426_0592 [Lactococcus garvieae DCC43]
MELKDIEHVAIGTHTRGIRMIEFNDYGKRFAPPEYEFEDKKLYTEDQLQEYAKAQAKKVFWYAAKGTSEDRALLARAIDYAFKEAQDES